jgi:lipoate-protein ligase A
MVEKVIMRAPNVVDLASYRPGRNIAGTAQAISARTCRHCGAMLWDGEREEECSSIANLEASLRLQAAQILRGLI